MTTSTLALAQQTGMGLARTSASLQRLLDERIGTWHGLSLADFMLLRTLAEAPQAQMNMQSLATTLHLAPSALVRQLVPLHKTGLIAREAGTVQLRDAGRRLQGEAAQTAASAWTDLCAKAKLADADLLTLQTQLHALERAAAMPAPSSAGALR